MATVSVDYENVGAAGLKGIEYLMEKDRLVLFYNDACKSISRELSDMIAACKCRFEVRKLLNTGKNGLDHYIAVECGRLLERGSEQIAVISKDKGYGAIADYFSVYAAGSKVKIIVSQTVEVGLSQLSDPEGKARRAKILHNRQIIDLAEFYADIRKRPNEEPQRPSLVLFKRTEPTETVKKRLLRALHGVNQRIIKIK